MNAYKYLGLVVSFVTNPVLRLLLQNTTRAYLLYIVEDEVLVIKTILSINLKYEWLMPGGGVKKGESLINAVLREAKEEIGLDISPKYLVQLNKVPIRSKWQFDYYVFMLKSSKKQLLEPNKIEVIDTQWIKIDEIDNYPCSAELKGIKNKIAMN